MRLATVGLGAVLVSLVGAAAQRGPALVAVSGVVEREVGAGQTFVGTVVPLRSSVVGSAVDGRVIEFAVNEGDRVTRGQPLARLLTATLEIERAAAQAELALRQQELAELQAGSRPEEIDQAKARMLSIKAQMEYWTARAERTRSLLQRNATSSEDLQHVDSENERVKQSHAEAEAAWKLAVQGPRKEKIAQAQARLQQQSEEVRRIEDMISKHTIVAPFDGYVVAEHTEVGAWLVRGAPVAEVAELDQVDVQVMVLEDYISHVEVGQSARLELGALPDMALTGEVALVVPKADTKSRSFPVKVRLPNQSRGGSVLLKAGMFARVTLAVGKKQKALLVPKDALVLGGQTPVVFVVDRDAKNAGQATVRPVPVEMGISDGSFIQVKGPLAVGQQVVIQGNERLQPGQAVKIAAAPPAGTGSAGGTTKSAER